MEFNGGKRVVGLGMEFNGSMRVVGLGKRSTPDTQTPENVQGRTKQPNTQQPSLRFNQGTGSVQRKTAVVVPTLAMYFSIVEENGHAIAQNDALAFLQQERKVFLKPYTCFDTPPVVDLFWAKVAKIGNLMLLFVCLREFHITVPVDNVWNCYVVQFSERAERSTLHPVRFMSEYMGATPAVTNLRAAGTFDGNWPDVADAVAETYSAVLRHFGQKYALHEQTNMYVLSAPRGGAAGPGGAAAAGPGQVVPPPAAAGAAVPRPSGKRIIVPSQTNPGRVMVSTDDKFVDARENQDDSDSESGDDTNEKRKPTAFAMAVGYMCLLFLFALAWVLLGLSKYSWTLAVAFVLACLSKVIMSVVEWCGLAFYGKCE